MPVQQDLEVSEELRQFSAFSELSREVLHDLAQVATQQRVHAGVTVAEQGQTPSTLTVLARGAVKLVRTTAFAGGESTVVLDVTRAPAVLGDAALFDGGAASATIVTLRSSHLIAFERRAVLKLAATHPALARALFAHLAHTVRRHVRRIDEVASGPVDERVRHLLDGLATEQGTPFGQGRFIAIPLRRRDIACMVNATTETVSRLLARFEREGQVRSTRDGIWWRIDVDKGSGASVGAAAENARSGKLLRKGP